MPSLELGHEDNALPLVGCGDQGLLPGGTGPGAAARQDSFIETGYGLADSPDLKLTMNWTFCRWARRRAGAGAS